MNNRSLVTYVTSLLAEKGSVAVREARNLALEEVTAKESRIALRHLVTYFKDTARPTLMALACEAVGGDPETVTQLAAPLILLAGGIDIHDDIIDRTRKKDFHLTVLGKSGPDNTLLTGDILFIKGLTLFAERLMKLSLQPSVSNQVLAVLRKTLLGLADGEVIELAGRRKTVIPIRDYLRFVELKGSDGEAYTKIGALVGSGTPEEVEALGRYGKHLGTLIILRDDLIDLLNPEEALADRHKYEVLPLPIFYALKKKGAKEQIIPIISKLSTNRKDRENLVAFTQKFGGVKEHEKLLQQYLSLALDQLKTLPETKARENLEKIAEACSLTHSASSFSPMLLTVICSN